MKMYDIILKKRFGSELSGEEINYFITGYNAGKIPDYQAAALCMAICFRGMTESETATMTMAMAESGDRLELNGFYDISVDKHSTGGVGDKTSLIVCPIAAALGCKVAKMSGRGLGHTGGTIDKLESIPGFRTALTQDEFLSQVDRIGIAVAGQTKDLAPADKKLYALRDVTATVDSIPLITASIMSKKIASGAKNLILDVKCGSGAFMKTYQQSRTLAESMVKIGKACGRNTVAVLTDMDTPLGSAVGNSLEVIEAAQVLKGEKKGDLYEVCVALATEMIIPIKKINAGAAKRLVIESISDGSAYQKLLEWISAQGGDTAYIENPELFLKSSVISPVFSKEEGYLSSMDTQMIGSTAVLLGAGRTKMGDRIDSSAGIIIEKKTGDYVKRGDVLAYLHTDNDSAIRNAAEQYISSLRFSDVKPHNRTLIYDIIR